MRKEKDSTGPDGVHIKGVISKNPGSCIPPIHRKALNSFFFFFFAFQGFTRDVWRFPGYRWNWSYSCWPTPQP